MATTDMIAINRAGAGAKTTGLAPPGVILSPTGEVSTGNRCLMLAPFGSIPKASRARSAAGNPVHTDHGESM